MECSSVTTRGTPLAKLRLFATALIIIVSDQVVKRVVVNVLEMGRPVDVLGTFFRLTRTENTGAALGLFRGGGIWLIIVSSIASIAIIAFVREIARMRSWEQTAFGLILGGAIGNLIDRVRFGAVIDFLDLGLGDARFPAFNVADSAITIGVVLIAFSFLLLKHRAPAHPADAQPSTGVQPEQDRG